jgi:hypothetical protein
MILVETILSPTVNNNPKSPDAKNSNPGYQIINAPKYRDPHKRHNKLIPTPKTTEKKLFT